MIKVEISGNEALILNTLLLDVNGTITTDGEIIPGVKERITRLSQRLNIYLVTCDMLGTAAKIADELKVEVYRIIYQGSGEAIEKANVLHNLKSKITIAIGNINADALWIRDRPIFISIKTRLWH